MPAWEKSTRRERLPPDWPRIRKRILVRDEHQCQWVMWLDGGRQKCLRPATEVDHEKRGDDHSESNLRSLCTWHHLRKSASEGAEVSAAQRRQIKNRFVRSESHPGVL